MELTVEILKENELLTLVENPLERRTFNPLGLQLGVLMLVMLAQERELMMD